VLRALLWTALMTALWLREAGDWPTALFAGSVGLSSALIAWLAVKEKEVRRGEG
jgi:hypothetical protein